MNVKEIMEIIDKLENRVNTYWNFYIVIVLAIVGWLMSSSNPFRESQYIVLAVVLILFSLLNTYMIFETLRSIKAWKVELVQRVEIEKSEIITIDLRSNLLKKVTLLRLFFPIVIHFVIDFSVLFAIYSKWQV